MKVMLPVAEKDNGKTTVAQGFHNAGLVCIFDSLNDSFEWMPIESISPTPGDFSNKIKGMGISAVISSYLPPMVLRIFTRSGLNTFRARGIDVKENIDFFQRNQLEAFTTESAREMWDCDSGCGSCNSKSCA